MDINTVFIESTFQMPVTDSCCLRVGAFAYTCGRTIQARAVSKWTSKEFYMGAMNDLLTDDLFTQALLPLTLRGPTDLDGFRRAARSLLARQILPGQVIWHSAGTPDPHSASASTGAHTHNAAFSDAPAVGVPPEFLTLCESAILHKDPDRFSLLYRILWRLVHEPGLRHNPLDADMARARDMAEAVRRDMHRIKAGVRFRTVQDDTFRSQPQGGLLHVAWFEPEHHIVEAVAPFFARRFARMRWAVLTPECCIQWDGAQLRFGPGAQKSDVPRPDAGQQHWLSCYQRIFRPARPKRRTAKKDTPHRHWHHRPESKITSAAVANDHEDGITMMDDTPETLLI